MVPGESASRVSAERASQGVAMPLLPEGVFSSVQLHLLEILSHVDAFTWPVIPLLFSIFTFLEYY